MGNGTYGLLEGTMTVKTVMKLTKSVAIKTKDLIATPNRWCCGNPQVKVDGGVAYCLGGALAQASIGDAGRMYHAEMDSLYREFVELAGIEKAGTLLPGISDWPASVYEFNDHNHYEDVIKALDNVIAALPDDDNLELAS